MTQKKTLPQLLEDLISSHAAHRQKAIKFLSERGDREALRLLQKQLRLVKKERPLLEQAIDKIRQRLK